MGVKSRGRQYKKAGWVHGFVRSRGGEGLVQLCANRAAGALICGLGTKQG